MTNRIIKIMAVGDICPGDKAIAGLGVCSVMRKNGVGFTFQHAGDFLHGADIAIANLEGILSSQVESHNSDLNFTGIPAFAEELRIKGFTVINVSNNHVLEHGNEIFMETVKILT